MPPEMLAEIGGAQIKERGDEQQQTEVMFIDANLLEVETTGDMALPVFALPDNCAIYRMASRAFDEIWHVQKI